MEEKFEPEEGIKFDRIICNLVLMLTEDPVKMLTSFRQSATEDCLLGLSVWGDKSRNNFHGQISDTIKEMGLEMAPSRSNFHLFKKIEELLDKTGWEIVLNWEQDVPMSYFHSSGAEHYFQFVVNKFTQFS